MSEPDLKSLFNKFRTTGTWLEGSVTGSGHIHSTYLIRTVENNQPDYILQKINNKVFPPVAEMMDNIQMITDHIRNKKGEDSRMQVLEIIETKSGRNHYAGPRGDLWRLYRKISPGISYDKVPNTNVAREAGRAFGQFIADLDDLPASGVFQVVPGFNSMEMRFDQFKKALLADPLKRAGEVKEEIDFVFANIDRMLIIPRLEKEGKLPLRITHNDTKINNVLFDESDRAVCVIDLDTVMPGLSLYDFGDTIRTAASTAEEDEADLEKVDFSTKVLKAYSEGFIEKTAGLLTPSETGHLALSAQYMTFIMGLRFLTDYIAGDIYYTISYGKQNIRRCRAQFRLMSRMAERYDETQDIILQTAERFRKG